jgi:hypothetical protein
LIWINSLPNNSPTKTFGWSGLVFLIRDHAFLSSRNSRACSATSFLQVLRLPLELLDLIGHSRPCGIPGKPALAASRNSRLLRALRREHPHADFVFLSVAEGTTLS